MLSESDFLVPERDWDVGSFSSTWRALYREYGIKTLPVLPRLQEEDKDPWPKQGVQVLLFTPWDMSCSLYSREWGGKMSRQWFPTRTLMQQPKLRSGVCLTVQAAIRGWGGKVALAPWSFMGDLGVVLIFIKVSSCQGSVAQIQISPPAPWEHRAKVHFSLPCHNVFCLNRNDCNVISSFSIRS